uniref:Glycosyltransferases n=1 Tax=Saccharum officinarum TaxID=4547 RepID=Q50HV5_SACOF|nr:glycosyltransferase [Saccharum officinarum]
MLMTTPPINPVVHLVSLVSASAVVLSGANVTGMDTITHHHAVLRALVKRPPAWAARRLPTRNNSRTTTTTAPSSTAATRSAYAPGPTRTQPSSSRRTASSPTYRTRNAAPERRGARPARPVIAVTPTTTYALQVPALTSITHTLRLVDAQLVWIVAEPGHRTDAVAAVLSRSNLDFLHITGPGESTASLRMHALREIRTKRMDGIVVFADENSILRTELFDEAQKVTTVGAVPVGILGEDDGTNESFLQAPSCDAEGNLVGYRVSEETVLPANRSDMLMSSRLEWAGFVVNARTLWEDTNERPVWVRNLNAIDDADARAGSPLALVTDAGRVEPLASCAQAALAWAMCFHSLHEVKFPHEWEIDPSPFDYGGRQQTV